MPNVAQAACGMGNPCAVVGGLSISTSPAPAGSVLGVTCVATDNGSVTRFSLTASAGTFSNGQASIDVSAVPVGPSASITVDWVAPDTVGATATISCAAWDNGGAMGTPTQGTWATLVVPIEEPNPNLPVITLTPSGIEAFPSETMAIDAAVVDPTGGSLTLTWSAESGTIAGDTDADPEHIAWTAANTPGAVAVTLRATGAGGTSVAAVSIRVVLAKVATPITLQEVGVGFHPWGLAADSAGQIYASDPRQGAVFQFTPGGGLTRTLHVGGRPAGIAVGPDGVLWVGDTTTGSVRGYDASGEVIRALGSGDGEFRAPNDIAIAATTGQVFVTDGRTVTVGSYDASGRKVGEFSIPAGFNDTSIAVNAAGTLLALSDATNGEVVLMTATGARIRTLGGGQLSRPTGVAFGPDNQVFVADAFQGTLDAFDIAGPGLGNIAGYGDRDGSLRIPLDVVVTPLGKLLVADTTNNRITAFDLPGAITGCVDDADCDGLPDAWETAHGLDPHVANDAHADSDGDGLTNLMEFAAGTNPTLADTDGDGVSDAAEIADGKDPLDASDQKPTIDAGPPEVTVPTLYTLTATPSDPNGDPLTLSWRQLGGPESVLGAPSDTPNVVLRAAGTYMFEVTASDGKATSEPSIKAVQVEDVAPTANAGADFGVLLGMPSRLDGRFSVDANGDALSYTWTQLGGPPATLTNALDARPTFAPWGVGTYTFALEVTELGRTSTGLAERRDLVRITVDAPNQHVPVAAVPARIEALEGETVILDGGASVDTDGDTLSFSWTQVAGAGVVLTRGDTAHASFVPSAAGVYTFALTVRDGGRDSAPRETVVVVGTSSNALPRTDAGPDLRVTNLAPVTLDCSASFDADGDALSCDWTQLRGPSVPTTRQDGTHTRFLPIEPGVYIFEAVASDGQQAGTTDRVTVVVDDPSINQIPDAVATAVATVTPGTAVELDATGSVDADGTTPLGVVWTQVAGPRAPLTATFADISAFTPPLPGTYTFELRVDDGVHQSPPATAQIQAACGAGAFGANCEVLCDPATTCGGNGTCASSGACTCHVGFEGADCGVLTCGDGVVMGDELCDDAGESAACNADCTPAVCGDGVTNAAAGEACDDAGESAACNADCTRASCGDGVINDTAGEACDDAGASATCDDDCTLAECGDLTVNEQAGEQCDDGAETQPCDADCSMAECGDGVLNVAAGEVCDDGAANSDMASDACRTTCALATCGDGVVDSGESCDDGSNNSNTAPDACRWTSGSSIGRRQLRVCVTAFCGDGVIDLGESCDDGQRNADRPGACRTHCALPVCGDGILDPGEACDGGADNSDTEPDRCRANCMMPHCGDLVVDDGEVCDDGAENSDSEPNACRAGDAATSACVPAHCGDGVVDRGESCDEGAENSAAEGSTCRVNCALATCGDGVLAVGEACDDGVDNSDEAPSACRTTCVAAWCGDGIVDAGEACDDGDENGEDGACSSSCERSDVDSDADAGGGDAGDAEDGARLVNNKDCGCTMVRGDGGSGMGGFAALLVLLGLVIVRRRPLRREAASARHLLTLTLGLVTWGLTTPAEASDPPHWTSPDGAVAIDCTSQCHIGHTALGGQLTSKSTNFNLCESCHVGGGLAQNLSIGLSDRAVLGVSGTSHAFGVNATNAAAGALPPQNPQMLARLDGGQITCSTCHNQHKAPKVPGTAKVQSPSRTTALGSTGDVTSGGMFNGVNGVWYQIEITVDNNAFAWSARDDSGVVESGSGLAPIGTQTLGTLGVTAKFSAGTYNTGEKWEFYASYPFLRGALDEGDNSTGTKFCRDCHRSFVNAAGSVRTYTGQKMSHPVGVVVPAGSYNNPPLDADFKPQGASADTNRSNDLLLVGAGGDEVQCISCHAMHFADSNTMTP